MPSWQKKDDSPCLMHNPSTPFAEQVLCWIREKRDESFLHCTMNAEQCTTPLKQRPLYLWPLSDIHRDLIYQQLFLELNKHLIFFTLSLTQMEHSSTFLCIALSISNWLTDNLRFCAMSLLHFFCPVYTWFLFISVVKVPMLVRKCEVLLFMERVWLNHHTAYSSSNFQWLLNAAIL